MMIAGMNINDVTIAKMKKAVTAVPATIMMISGAMIPKDVMNPAEGLALRIMVTGGGRMITREISRATTALQIMAAAITAEETSRLTGVKMKTNGTTATSATSKTGAAMKDVEEWVAMAVMKTVATETMTEVAPALHLDMAPILGLGTNMEIRAVNLEAQDVLTGGMMKEGRMKEAGKVTRV